MKNTHRILSISIMMAVLSMPALAKDEKPVASVNGVDITEKTLKNYMDVVNRSRPGSVTQQDALDDLIVTEVALQEAKKAKFQDREDIQAQIREATKKIILSTWTREKSESIEITDADLKAAYDTRMADQEKLEYKARHVLLKTEEEAKAVIKAVTDGGDFEKLAKEKSTGPSAAKGGDLGWFKPSTMVPPFAKAITAMKKGDVTQQPVRTNFGWHVIKLEGEREAQLPALEQLKPQLKRTLIQERMIAMLDEIKDKADVKIMLPEEKSAEAASEKPGIVEEKAK
ncbi:MAG: Peptidylprolyl isomerase [uncultured Thiotrichaceae bacterium]|uniref:peptidylprolyl isomerase n=1 Tax=uncultured Thiotrichaceae bacterium TaxID=298394 RepID=A0A6S6UIW6_9GAMM|nr:MAG: Peptidylprolyl isomerase [uncultured Thiotrichaceae bacterium]